jgi:hypothetical protein
VESIVQLSGIINLVVGAAAFLVLGHLGGEPFVDFLARHAAVARKTLAPNFVVTPNHKDFIAESFRSGLVEKGYFKDDKGGALVSADELEFEVAHARVDDRLKAGAVLG